MKDYFTIKEASEICKTSIWTLHRRIKENSIKSFRAGGGKKFLIAKEDLIIFLKENNIPIDESLFAPEKIRLLIVDDDEKFNRSLNRYFAQKPHFEIKSVTSGFEAGVQLKSFNPHMILLDIMLVDIDGRELLKTLKKDPSLSKVKVIAISGYIKDNEASSLFDLGFDDYLPKPFKLDVLLKKILKLLRKSNLLSVYK